SEVVVARVHFSPDGKMLLFAGGDGRIVRWRWSAPVLEQTKAPAAIEFRSAAMPQGGVVITFADITQRVSVANALAEVNLTLERRVEERTAELLSLNAALAVAKARADAANQDKTRFIAAATHDILQPLNAARLYATSLAERNLDGDAGRIATNIDISLRSVEEIFGAIMEISRIDAGRLEPDLEVFPVADLFHNLAIEFEPLARERNLDLRFVTTSAWITSDRRLMRRILQNLISNAIKYTDKGRILVGVKRRARDALLIVADTGPGIADNHKSLIFKEFQRIDDRAGPAKGLGLGLSIVERISHLLNADVKLSSKMGRGSMFWVRAPRARPVALPQVPARQATTDLNDLVVVCIDNEPAILEGMKTLLEGWGCKVIAAPACEQVIRLFSGERLIPDVVFADYHLDQTTGDISIERLRAHCGAEFPGVIITADHSPETAKKIRDKGLALLRKPVKAGALRALLTRYARQRIAAE
ncbi:MAG: hybrid sensor histidine kinase/response regulator, partial [Hyphomicrobiaceae bacterium]